MKKLWKVTVNEFGWRSPKTLYFESYEDARKAWAEHTAADDVVYAGRFTDEHAALLLSSDEDKAFYYPSFIFPDNEELRRWWLSYGEN